MRKFTKYFFCILVCFGLSSCLSSLKFPGRYVYSVNASEDLLRLFDIEVVYPAATGEDTRLYVTRSNWAKSIIKSDVVEGYEPRMDITMTAKLGAKNGKLLTQEEYAMGLEYSMEENKKMSTGTFKNLTKADESDVISMQFKVPVPDGANVDDITIEMPKLKYNKHFAFCFRVDDSYVNGWSKLFQAINGRWVDNVEFCHFGTSKTKGYQQATPMCFSDGCGNDRNYTFGEAIWPTWWNEYSPNGFIEDEITSSSNPYISWTELSIMTDMGNSVYWHNVDERTFDKGSSDAIIKGFEKDYEKTLSKLGFPMKILAQPDGNSNYLTAAKKSPLVYAVSATRNNEEYHLKSGVSLYKKNIFGGNTDANASIDSKLQELAKQSKSNDPILIGMLVHRVSETHLDMFRTIYSLYGKAGLDNLWVTTYDELYEYVERTRHFSYSSTSEDGYKYFTVTFPKEDKFIYDEVSFLIKGAKKAASPVSSNLIGFSSSVQNDGSVLVNCNTSTVLIPRIEKYTTLFHDTNFEEYYLDAKYMISLLREDLRAEYTKKLEQKPVDPDKRDLELNGTYNLKEIKWYIEQYDGKVFNCR